MKRTIHAMSRQRACTLRPNSTCAMLRICTPDFKYKDSREMQESGWLHFKTVSFADTATEVAADDWLNKTLGGITDEIAGEILVFFIDSLRAEDVIVHCDAGISRSVAVALAASEYGFGDLRLWDAESTLQANSLVLRKMRAAFAASPFTAASKLHDTSI